MCRCRFTGRAHSVAATAAAIPIVVVNSSYAALCGGPRPAYWTPSGELDNSAHPASCALSSFVAPTSRFFGTKWFSVLAIFFFLPVLQYLCMYVYICMHRQRASCSDRRFFFFGERERESARFMSRLSHVRDVSLTPEIVFCRFVFFFSPPVRTISPTRQMASTIYIFGYGSACLPALSCCETWIHV